MSEISSDLIFKWLNEATKHIFNELPYRCPGEYGHLKGKQGSPEYPKPFEYDKEYIDELCNKHSERPAHAKVHINDQYTQKKNRIIQSNFEKICGEKYNNSQHGGAKNIVKSIARCASRTVEEVLMLCVKYPEYTDSAFMGIIHDVQRLMVEIADSDDYDPTCTMPVLAGPIIVIILIETVIFAIINGFDFWHAGTHIENRKKLTMLIIALILITYRHPNADKDIELKADMCNESILADFRHSGVPILDGDFYNYKFGYDDICRDVDGYCAIASITLPLCVSNPDIHVNLYNYISANITNLDRVKQFIDSQININNVPLTAKSAIFSVVLTHTMDNLYQRHICTIKPAINDIIVHTFKLPQSFGSIIDLPETGVIQEPQEIIFSVLKRAGTNNLKKSVSNEDLSDDDSFDNDSISDFSDDYESMIRRLGEDVTLGVILNGATIIPLNEQTEDQIINCLEKERESNSWFPDIKPLVDTCIEMFKNETYELQNMEIPTLHDKIVTVLDKLTNSYSIDGSEDILKAYICSVFDYCMFEFKMNGVLKYVINEEKYDFPHVPLAVLVGYNRTGHVISIIPVNSNDSNNKYIIVDPNYNSRKIIENMNSPQDTDILEINQNVIKISGKILKSSLAITTENVSIHDLYRNFFIATAPLILENYNQEVPWLDKGEYIHISNNHEQHNEYIEMKCKYNQIVDKYIITWCKDPVTKNEYDLTTTEVPDFLTQYINTIINQIPKDILSKKKLSLRIIYTGANGKDDYVDFYENTFGFTKDGNIIEFTGLEKINDSISNNTQCYALKSFNPNNVIQRLWNDIIHSNQIQEGGGKISTEDIRMIVKRILIVTIVVLSIIGVIILGAGLLEFYVNIVRRNKVKNNRSN
jgi:hypothetical protein